MSRSNTRLRRSNWKAARQQLVSVVVDGDRHLVPRQLVATVHRGLVDPRTGRPVRG
jgi:large subunit ribosomal protein L32